ncbi:MAG: hypothetical protein ACRDJW_09530 [Thermomicrobiales bacterium]
MRIWDLPPIQLCRQHLRCCPIDVVELAELRAELIDAADDLPGLDDDA